jgi:8-oxo-dGTP pyrophosphatase MutT (NUDIX family)
MTHHAIVHPIRAELPLSGEALHFEMQYRDAIDAYWAKRLEDNPRLWNGAFYLFTNTRVADGFLKATAHKTDFATFLFHRHCERDPDVTHITGTSLMETAGGALVGMQMAAHTANAGHIYFPAGSFDPDDLVNGRLDPLTNVRRELREETGLDLPVEWFSVDHVGVYDDNTWHVAPRCKLPLTFAECETQLAEHQAVTGDDEIARLVAIRRPDDTSQMRPFAEKLARWFFEARESGWR